MAGDGRDDHWSWATTLRKSRLSTRGLWRCGHARWDIENDCFNTLATHWGLNHCFKHTAQAIVNFLLTSFIVYALMQSFWLRNLKPARADPDADRFGAGVGPGLGRLPGALVESVGPGSLRNRQDFTAFPATRRRHDARGGGPGETPSRTSGSLPKTARNACADNSSRPENRKSRETEPLGPPRFLKARRVAELLDLHTAAIVLHGRDQAGAVRLVAGPVPEVGIDLRKRVVRGSWPVKVWMLKSWYPLGGLWS